MPPSPTNVTPVANLAKSTDLLADFLRLRGSEAAGIDKVVSPHRIRHSAITTYLDASDGNLRAAQGLSRHANLNTLSRYDDNRHKYQTIATNILANLI